MRKRSFALLRQAAILALPLLGVPAHAEVPLTRDSTGHAVIPAFVNGKGPFDFIFDTGADESGVYAWFAKLLALPEGKTGEISGATGNVPMVVSRIVSLSVDGHAISDVDADTIPDRPDGAKLAGIVGVDLMMRQFAVLD